MRLSAYVSATSGLFSRLLHDRDLPASQPKIHDLGMRFSKLLILLALVAPAWAGIVEDVRGALAQNSFPAAEADLQSYRGKNGFTAEYVEAYSWMGRAALSAHDYDQAASYAKQTKALALEQLDSGCVPRHSHHLGNTVAVSSHHATADAHRPTSIARSTG